MTEITNLALYLAEKYGIAVNKDEAKISKSIDNCPLTPITQLVRDL